MTDLHKPPSIVGLHPVVFVHWELTQEVLHSITVIYHFALKHLVKILKRQLHLVVIKFLVTSLHSLLKVVFYLLFNFLVRGYYTVFPHKSWSLGRLFLRMLR